jgi:hypothetical protein
MSELLLVVGEREGNGAWQARHGRERAARPVHDDSERGGPPHLLPAPSPPRTQNVGGALARIAPLMQLVKLGGCTCQIPPLIDAPLGVLFQASKRGRADQMSRPALAGGGVNGRSAHSDQPG